MKSPRPIAPSLNVLIVDRRGFDRSALSALCGEDEQLRVVAATDDSAEACQVLSTSFGSSVVLLGRTLVRRDGPDVVTRLRACDPDLRIILVGIGEDQSLRLEAVRIGADGFLRRDGDPSVQLATIRGEDGAVPRWNGEGPQHRAVS